MSFSDYTLGDKALWQAGIRYERERIITLLKSDENWMCVCDRQCKSDEYCSARAGIIELITTETQ